MWPTAATGRRRSRPRTALQAALARVGITLQLHGYPSATYYTNFAGAPNYVHQHNLGVDFGGWSPDWPDGYGMLDELVDGNTIVAAGNTNISELNDPTINSLFTRRTTPKLGPRAAERDLRPDRQGGHGDAVILPEVYAKTLLYRPPNLTNAYIEAPFGEYNYAVLGVSG